MSHIHSDLYCEKILILSKLQKYHITSKLQEGFAAWSYKASS